MADLKNICPPLLGRIICKVAFDWCECLPDCPNETIWIFPNFQKNFKCISTYYDVCEGIFTLDSLHKFSSEKHTRKSYYISVIFVCEKSILVACN